MSDSIFFEEAEKMLNFFKKPKSGQEEILEYIKTIEGAVFSKVYNDLKKQVSDDQEAKVLAMIFLIMSLSQPSSRPEPVALYA